MSSEEAAAAAPPDGPSTEAPAASSEEGEGGQAAGPSSEDGGISGSEEQLPPDPAPGSGAAFLAMGMGEDVARPSDSDGDQEHAAEESPGEAGVEAEGGGQTDEAGAPKARTIEQMMSLKPGDDERTEISKKISWILRHGAKKVSVSVDEEGWVNLDELCNSDILSSINPERLMEVINDSNSQKQRYEFKDAEEGERFIRAISKGRRNQTGWIASHERRRKDRDELGEDKVHSKERERRERRDHRRAEQGDAEQGVVAPPPAGVHGGGGGDWLAPPDPSSLTYEEQCSQGWRPIWSGNVVSMMVRGNDTCRPGRRDTDMYASERERGHSRGKGDDRGKGEYGKGDQKGRGKHRDGYHDEYDGYSRDYGKGDYGKGGYGKSDYGKGYGKSDYDYGKGSRSDYGKGSYGKGDHGKGGMEYPAEASDYHGAKGEAKGKGNRYESGIPRTFRWRVASGKEAIVRAGFAVESEVVGQLLSGTPVNQIGEERVLKNGIIRMQVEALEPQAGLKGWVTRSAEAAGGPLFFKPDRGGRRGGGGGQGGSGGGRRG